MDSSTTRISSILDLPLELRLRIYSYIFEDLTYRNPLWKPLKRRFRTALYTLSTCRQIRGEALPVFRSNLTIKQWGPRADDPPFLIENATKFILPHLELRNLRYCVACLPHVRFVRVKATTLVPSESGPIRDKDHLVARLRGADDAVFLSKVVANPEYRDVRTPLWNRSGEICEIRFVHEIQWGREGQAREGILNFIDRYFLEIDPFQQTMERVFHYDDRYIPAKKMLLLTEGLSFPLLWDPAKDIVIYLMDGHASKKEYNLELRNQETFYKALEKALPCG